jgi:hypothetical protein
MIMKGNKTKQYELASVISGFACSSHSVTHLDEEPVSSAPDLRTFKESHSSGNPLKSVYVDLARKQISMLKIRHKHCPRYGSRI